MTDAAQIRAELRAKFPAEFERGYRYGRTGGVQPECDACGYPIGFREWPEDRRNAWWAGFNLGHVEKEPPKKTKQDFEQEWRAADRKAWLEYRKWEDKHFPVDPAKPFKDPPGMVAARRAFEREQEISKAREIWLREASRVRR
jgi:hypothetical protein